MHQKIFSVSTLSVLFFMSLVVGAQAQLANDDWPASAFEKPLPGKVKNGQTVTPDTGTSAKDLIEYLNRGLFLKGSDVANFSKNIESLVGNYFYVDEEKKEIQLIGPNFDDKNKTVGIKDLVKFNSIVNHKFDAGAEVPAFLKLDLKNNELAQLTITDIVTVSGKITSNQVACNAPFPDIGKEKERLYYITIATVSMVYKKKFNEKSQGGSGLVSMIALKGKNYYSSTLEQRIPVISFSYIPVRTVPQGHAARLCAKYNDAYKTMQIAALGGAKKVRSLRSAKPVKPQSKFSELEEQLSRVLQKGDGKSLSALRGKVMGIVRK